MENANSKDYLEKIKIQVIENLKRTAFAPSVQMTDVPRDPPGMDDEADAILDDMDEDENKDVRHTKRRWDKYIEKDGELSDSEPEDEAGNTHARRQATTPKRRNIQDHRPAHLNTDNESVAATPEQTAPENGDSGTAVNHVDHADGIIEKRSASHTPAEPELGLPLENGPAPPAPVDTDGDVVMDPPGPTHPAVGPTDVSSSNNQITTPPLSPTTALEGSAIGAPPTPPSQPPATAGQENGVADEGDTLEDSTVAREEASRDGAQEPAPTQQASTST